MATCRLANSPLLSQFKHKHRNTRAEGRVRTRAPVLSLFELKGRCEAAEAAEVQDAWYVLNSLFLAEVSLSWCCYILVWRGLSHTSQNKTRNTVTLNINPAISWSLIMLLQCKHEDTLIQKDWNLSELLCLVIFFVIRRYNIRCIPLCGLCNT